MPVAIATALIESASPELVQVVVTGLTGATNVSVWAEPPSSPPRIIRGGLDVDPAGDTLVLVDPIPELGRPVVYVVEWTAAGVRSQLSSAAVTVPDPGRHVLSDPFTGESVLVDVVLTDDERTNALSGSTLYPTGSELGVAITDGRRADAGVLQLIVPRTDVPALLALLDDSSVIASRHPNHACDIAALEVLAVKDVSRSRYNRAGDRLVLLPFDVVAQPDPSTPYVAFTLADIAAYYGTTGTLGDIADDLPTLLAIATKDWTA